VDRANFRGNIEGRKMLRRISEAQQNYNGTHRLNFVQVTRAIRAHGK
jgi:hypothetical protein